MYYLLSTSGRFLRSAPKARISSRCRCDCRFAVAGSPKASRRMSGATSRESNSHYDDSSDSSCTVKIHSALSSSSPYQCIDYARSWAWQQALLGRRLAARRRRKEIPTYYSDIEDQDSVLLFEHKPVYTLGRGASEDHLTFLQDETEECNTIRSMLSRKRLAASKQGVKSARLAMNKPLSDEILLGSPIEDIVEMLSTIACPVLAPNGVPIYRVDRGGEVTFHGPSQLVVYPNFDLRKPPFQQDLHWYLRMVEEVVIKTLKHFDIESQRDEINTGVWVGSEKIAAVGVSASRYITTHGFALNVSPDMAYFDTSVILPCGLEGRGVTSIQKVLLSRNATARVPKIEEVSSVAVKKMQQVFNVQIEHSFQLR